MGFLASIVGYADALSGIYTVVAILNFVLYGPLIPGTTGKH